MSDDVRWPRIIVDRAGKIVRRLARGEPAPLDRNGQLDLDRLTAPTDAHELGMQAKRLIDDPVLNHAFDLLAADIAAAWRATKPDDPEARERAYALHWGLEGVKGKLRALFDNAKMIEADIRRQKSADRPARDE